MTAFGSSIMLVLVWSAMVAGLLILTYIQSKE